MRKYVNIRTKRTVLCMLQWARISSTIDFQSLPTHSHRYLRATQYLRVPYVVSTHTTPIGHALGSLSYPSRSSLWRLRRYAGSFISASSRIFQRRLSSLLSKAPWSHNTCRMSRTLQVRAHRITLRSGLSCPGPVIRLGSARAVKRAREGGAE